MRCEPLADQKVESVLLELKHRTPQDVTFVIITPEESDNVELRSLLSSWRSSKSSGEVIIFWLDAKAFRDVYRGTSGRTLRSRAYGSSSRGVAANKTSCGLEIFITPDTDLLDVLQEVKYV
jgi:hypothetical protein